ncbi:unnamed protein product [Gulo gulo]|uniref:Uncharacterized protein n=1 Tax=Gulo gulo TaxID=48420 RepID=A0A9X9LMN5_GULGU|nr:unnamed protein product [Gulo gulo]
MQLVTGHQCSKKAADTLGTMSLTCQDWR